jgi:hypothetical protein
LSAASTPAFFADPTFSNRVRVAPTDGGMMRATSASFYSLL